MSEASRRRVRQGLEAGLERLWRYALVLSASKEVAEDLVQSTCRRAIEQADQLPAETRLDRWLFVLLRSIWLEEVRATRIGEAKGIDKTGPAIPNDGAFEIGANNLATQVLKMVGRLPESQRETVLLVYGEGYSYAEAASAMGVMTDVVASRLTGARSALAKVS